MVDFEFCNIILRQLNFFSGTYVIESFVTAISENTIFSIVLFICTTLGAIAGVPRFFNALHESKNKRQSRKISTKLSAATGVASFTSEDIAHACRSYLDPNCTQTDPSDEDDIRSVVALSPLFKTIDSHFESGGQKRHVILLADSGMGKTSFCINYYARELRKKDAKRRSVAIVPLGRGDAIEQIKSIPNKRDTICFLDAFDEDPKAATDQIQRLEDLMRAAADFRNVVVTCRSQFFSKDDAIPSGSGIMYAAPRRAGQSRELPLHRLFLAPFSTTQIKQYLNKQFPLTRIDSLAQRRAATQMVAAIPELSARPMLLELVPDLVREQRTISQLFGLYEFLVEKWLERESEWIKKDDLREISIELAVTAYLQQRNGHGDRLSPALLEQLANQHSTPLESWRLKSRSLLNRDIEGQFKFAHRSVMEYLFLLAAIAGDARCFTVEWTDLMKDLLVSWGMTSKDAQLETASALLRQEHGKTGLFPLASPLKQPQRRSAADCRAVLRREGVSYRQARSIPVAWRNHSLKLNSTTSAGAVSAFDIYDSTHGLRWLVNDVSLLQGSQEREIYRDSYDSRDIPISTEVEYRDARPIKVKRLPSIDELLCLWESEPYIIINYPIAQIFDKNELYWVGDSGDNGPICCSFGDKPHEVEYLKLHASKLADGNRAIHIYEFLGRYGLLNRLSFKAMAVYIAES